MDFVKWMNSCVKRMEWYDIALVKIAVAAFVLMIAKLWMPILSLEWYWYLVIAILAAILPWSKMFKK